MLERLTKSEHAKRRAEVRDMTKATTYEEMLEWLEKNGDPGDTEKFEEAVQKYGSSEITTNGYYDIFILTLWREIPTEIEGSPDGTITVQSMIGHTSIGSFNIIGAGSGSYCMGPSLLMLPNDSLVVSDDVSGTTAQGGDLDGAAPAPVPVPAPASQEDAQVSDGEYKNIVDAVGAPEGAEVAGSLFFDSGRDSMAH